LGYIPTLKKKEITQYLIRLFENEAALLAEQSKDA
jgi:hypothetical protein